MGAVMNEVVHEVARREAALSRAPRHGLPSATEGQGSFILVSATTLRPASAPLSPAVVAHEQGSRVSMRGFQNSIAECFPDFMSCSPMLWQCHCPPGVDPGRRLSKAPLSVMYQ